MRQFLSLIDQVEKRGVWKNNRTGVRTLSMFGAQEVFDLREGFPLVTTKQTSFKNIAVELLWFIQANPDISFLHEHNCHIWDEWVKPDGTFGPIYGTQWRTWLDRKIVDFANSEAGQARREHLAKLGYIEDVFDDVGNSVVLTRTIDQLQLVIDRLKSSPDDRRLIVSAWNVGDVESGEMALPPCHSFFQFWTRELTRLEREEDLFKRIEAKYGEKATDGFMQGARSNWACMSESTQDGWLREYGVPERGLSCQLYQRSCDLFLGVPYNIASYALLTHMIGRIVNMLPLEFVWTGGDVHLYSSHMDQVAELKKRDPMMLPQLVIADGIKRIDDFKLEDFRLEGYNHHPALKAPVAV